MGKVVVLLGFLLSCSSRYKLTKLDEKQLFPISHTLELVHASYLKSCVKEKRRCDIKQLNVFIECKKLAQKHTQELENMLID